MQSELFQKFLLEGATETRWSHVYTAEEMLDLINAATAEQINYVHSEGEHRGKSVLWLVAKDCNFLNEKQYKVFEHLLSLSNVDAINARSKEDKFSKYEFEPERSVLSLVAQTTGYDVFKQFKLIAKLLEKGAEIYVHREEQLFYAVKSSYHDAISFCISCCNVDGADQKQTIATIKNMRENYEFIIASLSKLCLKYVLIPGFNDVDPMKMSSFLTLVANDLINGVSHTVNLTQYIFNDSLDQDDINTLRELLQMFKTEPGKVLLDYANNKTLLAHELLSEPPKEYATARRSNRLRHRSIGN